MPTGLTLSKSAFVNLAAAVGLTGNGEHLTGIGDTASEGGGGDHDGGH